VRSKKEKKGISYLRPRRTKASPDRKKGGREKNKAGKEEGLGTRLKLFNIESRQGDYGTKGKTT